MTVLEKSCARCKLAKPASSFKPNTRMKSGLSSWCLDCYKAYDSARSLKRRPTRRIGRPPKQIIDGQLPCSTCKMLKSTTDFPKDVTTPSGFNARCKACCSASAKQYHQRYAAVRSAKAKAWNQANPEKRRVIEQRKLATDISYRISCRLRARLSNALRLRIGGSVIGRRVASAVRDLGCTLDELMVHLERQFTPGMSWTNYGDWHIDHIKPLASFDLTDRVQLLVACHFTNLQPLWAEENLKKGDR